MEDKEGNLYGTTQFGGDATCQCGVVFKLDTTGKEAVMYSFTGGSDGAYPFAGLVMDGAGNLYGTTGAGGGDFTCSSGTGQGCGVVFKITL